MTTIDAPPDLDEPTPMWDEAAETAVLGALLLDEHHKVLPQILGMLAPGDFFRGGHQVIYQAIVDLDAVDSPYDPVTVAHRLAADGSLGRVGGPAYLHHLTASVPALSAATHYARQIRECAALRRLVEAGTRIAQMGRTAGTDDVNAVQAAALTEIEAAIGGAAVTDRLPAFDEAFEEALESLEADQDAVGLPWPGHDLNRLLLPMTPGQLIVIGARPSVGKSTGALDIVREQVIRHRVPTIVFSLEMQRREWLLRMLSAEARVILSSLVKGRTDLTDDDWWRINGARGRLTDLPLLIDDTESVSSAHIRAVCKRGVPLDGVLVPPRLVVVDYLQLMSGTTRAENRQQEVARFSRELKGLAKSLRCSVLALSQLNRAAMSRADKKPNMADLRESGQIEQDSDVIVLLYREDQDEPESPRAGEADWIVAKQRNGQTGTVTLAFQGHYARFVDMSYRGDPWRA